MLAAFTHPSHIVIYAPGDSFTCRRVATRNLLGIYNLNHNYFSIFRVKLMINYEINHTINNNLNEEIK
ncbi:hypothetical protein C5468_13235 [Photorhabdus luminescens subsp. mexicana]|uniref:Uncharacterized protein n=1 Tax=Photorhabdus luminescens subsp. mexicana TaxID=2100167 RepID=A0A4R4J880_PHOLU|nr:hypothetical protein C5468_13235 [Photorhabdus luminescens subsp. mexicana]